MLRQMHDMDAQRSKMLFSRGEQVFPDGTTRATVQRDPFPRYIARGEGAYLVDVDGNRLLDLNNNFTTLIHGHGFEPAARAVEKLLRDGTCFSNPTEHEIHLAELLCARIPAVEHIRFVNTGTEAVMFAIKAARAFTGRPGVARIEGAYHGAYDWAEAGQGGTPESWGAADDPRAVPAYAGMPASVAEDVLVLRFNDAEAVRQRLKAHSSRLACLLIDPMPSRAGLIAPDPDFLLAVAEVAREEGILLVADEVLNLRQGYHGASARYGLEPDLVAMGKIIGGGFPIGAIGGSRAVMGVFSSTGKVRHLPQGGTFSANPVSMVAGLESMKALTQAAFERLEHMGERLRTALGETIARHQVEMSVSGAASLFRFHPKARPPRDYRECCMTAREARLMQFLTRHFTAHGIILPYGAAACLSTPMGEAELTRIVACFDTFLTCLPQLDWEMGA